MAERILFIPIILHLAAAVAMFFAWGTVRFQRRLSIATSIAALVLAIFIFSLVWQGGTMCVQAAGWKAPFGITMAADTLSALLLLLVGVSGLAVSVFAAGTIVAQRVRFGFFPILHILLMGLNGAFLTADVFNLYVWFEVIIISSFVLLTIGGERPQLEGAVKYFTLNMFASVIFLTAIAIAYGITGTLNMADLAVKMGEVSEQRLIDVSAVLFLIGFGTKAAIFPLYFWLPASYHTPPDAVSAIFGGLLTKLGVYAIIRLFTLIYAGNALLSEVLSITAGLTIIAGGAAALVQNNLRKAFSYLIICHIGYMIAGVGMASVLAISGAVFYLVHDIVVKTNLFMVAGLIHRITGTSSIRDLGGLYKRYPLISLLLAVPLFSLVGIPPLSGFWPKVALLEAGVNDERWLISAMILTGSLLTLFIIAKIWAEVFWKPAPEHPVRNGFTFFEKFNTGRRFMYLFPIAFLGAISIYIGLGASHIELLSNRIANELVDSSHYIQTILNFTSLE